MRFIEQHTQFRRDMKLARKRRKDISKLEQIIWLLAAGEPLPARNRDHLLTGNWRGRRECHIEPDWLLIYQVRDDLLILERTGSHADLFE
jgi:mRNA interferase YafQ